MRFLENVLHFVQDLDRNNMLGLSICQEYVYQKYYIFGSHEIPRPLYCNSNVNKHILLYEETQKYNALYRLQRASRLTQKVDYPAFGGATVAPVKVNGPSVSAHLIYLT